MGFAVTSYPNTTPLIGLFTSQVDSQKELLAINSSETTLGVNTERYNLILSPCQAMDTKVIDILDDINTDKNSITDTGDLDNYKSHAIYYPSANAANTATQTLYDGVLSSVEAYTNLNFAIPTSATTFTAGVAVSSSGGGTGVVAITSTSAVGVAFSVMIRNVSGTFGIGQTVFVGSPGIAFSSPSSLDYVGTGQIYNDIVVESFYPNLEPPNTGVENPFTGLQANILSSSNDGLGVANTFYGNSLLNAGTLGTLVPTDTANNSLGRVYAFDTNSGSAEETTITNLISDVTSTRTGISSYNNGASTLKGHKKGFAVNMWTLNKSNSDIQSNITDLESVITILQDPANGGPY
jgi:hypothetical protein